MNHLKLLYNLEIRLNQWLNERSLGHKAESYISCVVLLKVKLLPLFATLVTHGWWVGCGSQGVVSWTCDPVLSLGQRFHSCRLFCCNSLGQGINCTLLSLLGWGFRVHIIFEFHDFPNFFHFWYNYRIHEQKCFQIEKNQI